MSSNLAALPVGKGHLSLAPQTLDEAMRFADLLAKFSITPKDYQGNPGNIIITAFSKFGRRTWVGGSAARCGPSWPGPPD